MEKIWILVMLLLLPLKEMIKEFIFCVWPKMKHLFIKKDWFDWKKRNIIKRKSLLSAITMDKQIITFGNIEIEKHKFYRFKSPIVLEDMGIGSALASNKISSDEKY